MTEQRNIEIKARIGSNEEFERRISIARNLTKTDGEIIKQRDVFFNSKTGRLKLRYLESPQRSQLVFYDRPNVFGPKLSKYNKVEVDKPEMLQNLLAQSNGIQGEIFKMRFLFIYKETTRIHLDKVDKLGNFMEFEVCLNPEQTTDEGTATANELMNVFNIKKEDLMDGAYFDELKP